MLTVGRASRAALVLLTVLVAGCGPRTNEEKRFALARRTMVDNLVTARVVTDKALVAALAETPRQIFVSSDVQSQAYQDVPLAAEASRYVPSPTACGMALQAMQARPGNTVLQVGLDDGYRPAVLSRLGCKVFVVVMSDAAAEALRQELVRAGRTDVKVRVGDTAQGWAEHGPYDVILASCDANHVPEMIVDQLKPNGRLVAAPGVMPRTLSVMAKDKRRQEMSPVATLEVPQGSFQSTAAAPPR